jgi:hypothetical protein
MIQTPDEGGTTDSERRREYEQALMRIGRRMQALGQLFEQNPARLVAKGVEPDPEITGSHPVQIEMDDLRAMFDVNAGGNVGQLLAQYHALLGRLKKAGT